MLSRVFLLFWLGTPVELYSDKPKSSGRYPASSLPGQLPPRIPCLNTRASGVGVARFKLRPPELNGNHQGITPIELTLHQGAIPS